MIPKALCMGDSRELKDCKYKHGVWKLKIMAQQKELWTYPIPILRRRVLSNVKNLCVQRTQRESPHSQPIGRKPTHLQVIRRESEIWAPASLSTAPLLDAQGELVGSITMASCQLPWMPGLPCTPQNSSAQSWHLIHTLYFRARTQLVSYLSLKRSHILYAPIVLILKTQVAGQPIPS